MPQYDTPVGLGRPANHAADFGNGAADEVRILGRVPSEQQIRGLAVNGAGPNGKNAEGPDPADGAVRALVPLLAWIPAEPVLFEDVGAGSPYGAVEGTAEKPPPRPMRTRRL